LKIHVQFFNISSHATLQEIFTAKYNGVLPRTPQVRPKSKIYTPKRDNEHPRPFHVEENHVPIYLRTSFRVELERLLLFIKITLTIVILFKLKDAL